MARETMTVAPFFAPEGPVLRSAAASTASGREILPELVRALDARRGLAQRAVGGDVAAWGMKNEIQSLFAIQFVNCVHETILICIGNLCTTYF